MENWFLLYAAVGVFASRAVVCHAWDLHPKRQVYLAVFFAFWLWPTIIARFIWLSVFGKR